MEILIEVGIVTSLRVHTLPIAAGHRAMFRNQCTRPRLKTKRLRTVKRTIKGKCETGLRRVHPWEHLEITQMNLNFYNLFHFPLMLIKINGKEAKFIKRYYGELHFLMFKQDF